MNGIPNNPNLRRRLAPGLLAGLLTPFLKPLLRTLRKREQGKTGTLTVFQSYLVGDLFMALPALKRLAKEFDTQILCRPDCVEILRSEGLMGVAFDNAFLVRPGFKTFLKTFQQAWRLRGSIGAVALDLDADPRTAFWIKIAGAACVVSFDRTGASLFDCLLPMPLQAVHQAERDTAVVSEFLKRRESLAANLRLSEPGTSTPPSTGSAQFSSESWLVSCWTRKDTKNWPLDRWGEFLEQMLEAKIPFQVLAAPDGDAAFQEFQSLWTRRTNFVTGSLKDIAVIVKASAGVIATDNFVGHMAGYFGKPVLWINGSSDPAQVAPKGSKTRCVQVDPMVCRPCGHRCVNPEYKACLHRLGVKAVWRAFGELRAELNLEMRSELHATGFNPADETSL